jgi:hypothetical protein
LKIFDNVHETEPQKNHHWNLNSVVKLDIPYYLRRHLKLAEIIICSDFGDGLHMTAGKIAVVQSVRIEVAEM